MQAPLGHTKKFSVRNKPMFCPQRAQNVLRASHCGLFVKPTKVKTIAKNALPLGTTARGRQSAVPGSVHGALPLSCRCLALLPLLAELLLARLNAHRMPSAYPAQTLLALPFMFTLRKRKCIAVARLQRSHTSTSSSHK